MPKADALTISLWPKEHGAYVQLGLPLGTALALGAPGLASACLALAAVSLFIAHEPVLVALGSRGGRQRRVHGDRARRAGGTWMVLALAAGAVGLWRGGTVVVVASTVPLLLVLLLAPVILRGNEKTLIGELLVAAALTAAGMPVAVAGRVGLDTAFSTWLVWALGFAVSTAGVRGVVAAHRGRTERAGLWVAALASLAAAVLALRLRVGPAALPILLVGWALILRPIHPRHLRRVGWALLVAGVASAVGVVALARGT